MKDIPISLIAGVNRLGYIGDEKGDLIVKNRYDLQRFKELSQNGVLIMGRKTYESLPKALPGRVCVVVTRNAREVKHPDGTKDNQFLAVGDINNALDAAFQVAERLNKERIVIAGGADIYARYLLDAETVHLTRFSDENLGGAKFPIQAFELHIASGRLALTETKTVYDGELEMTFESYGVPECIERHFGEFIQLRNGIRLHAPSITSYAATEDSVVISAGRAMYQVSEHEMHLDRLLQELDRVVARTRTHDHMESTGMAIPVDMKLAVNED